MDSISTATSSMLTRQRVGVALLSLATVLSLGYAGYAGYGIYQTSPEPGHQLRRSNAVRHRRRSVPDVYHERHDSEASWTSQEETQADENVDHTTVRPVTDGETVAEEHVMEDDWYNEPLNFPNQRAGQNIVSLLFRVSEDNARRNAYVHRGCQCNACGIVPIRGIRYRCSNCADFDLCETCESQGLHIKTHIFYKIKIPAPRLGPRQMQPVWYTGDPESCLRNLPRQLIAKLSKETGFERPELEALWEQWTFMANTEWREDPDDLCLAMDRKTFERYIVPSGGYKHAAPNLLHDRIFAFYDTNNDDLIGFTEFLLGTSYRKRKDRLKKVFEGYDVDGDGYVNRRDFLRLFRAYYILFKQMHRDIVEGLDDQVMSSPEAQQLISSRQPLSSLFGREGGFPSADPDRPLEGKVINHQNGDVIISDGMSRAVKEDNPDIADRESMLTSLFSKPTRIVETLFSPTSDNFHSPGMSSTTQYLSALLNPPSRVDELPALLVGGSRGRNEFFVVLNEERTQEESSESPGEDSGRDSNPSGREETNGASAVDEAGDNQDESSQPTRQQALLTPNEEVNRERELRRREHRMGRRTRVNTRRKLLDRWKRRQFYLDEEEGAAPPEGWDDEDDILASLDSNAESSKSAQFSPSFVARSRSSSKVRFAEEPDDFDIRSNPSTSSRSVPERWGGYDVPDAEKDAGKEVFYQVIQQAFNELLDILFKPKEDLAVEAAETQEVRNKHRHLFESIDLNAESKRRRSPSTSPELPVDPNKPINERSLPELLATSGYSIAQPAGATNSPGAEEIAPEEQPIVGDVALSTEMAEEIPGEQDTYRDPTLPQFRPNFTSASSQPVATPVHEKMTGVADEKKPETPLKGKSSEGSDEVERSAKKPETSSSLPTPIPRETLIKWKRLDAAEEEAKIRGGWGKLSYEEFEEIYRLEESRGSRLDYLGTWIDFCIPYN
ncbi:hypothetical protein OQA88_3991 [Cercophora sp. LCS_1]